VGPCRGEASWRVLDDLSLQVVVLGDEMAGAFRLAFHGLPRVVVTVGRWENLPDHDCFVTAGNAYGLMSAGVDAAVVHRFGASVQEAVQLRIMNEFLGEQPIGTAFLLETGSPRVPLLCHAPTMRMPGDIRGTEHVYLATRAALLATYHWSRGGHARIRTAVFPAFGTGFGGMDPREAARQMATAWRLFLQPPYPPDWDRAIAREQLIRPPSEASPRGGAATAGAEGDPPAVIGGVKVLRWALVKAASHPDNAAAPGTAGKNSRVVAVAICAAQQAFYLFGCDASWRPLTDTWHETLAEAVAQAESEYDNLAGAWRAV
jgi:O-acetyl-ADP-ribose deacetylase (regulator of RNase III)